MLNLSTVEAARKSVACMGEARPRTTVKRRHSEEVLRICEHFGDVHAESFSCRANGINELEVLADTHTLLLRCEGTASRCEIVWPESGHRQKLAELRPGGVVFNPAANSVRVSKKDAGSYRYLSVHVPPCALAQVNDDKRDVTRLTLPPQAGPCHAGLCRVMLAMRDEIDDPGPAGALYKETLGLQAVIQLLRCTCRLTIPPAKGGLSAWRLRQAIEILEADMTKSPSVRELAAVVDLSPAHFCTAFKQSTGCSPHRYLLQRKIARAKEMMANPRLSLTEIALESGFGSSSQFATTFRSIEGATPTAYRHSL
jgi:AraC-like DNA-binding protein